MISQKQINEIKRLDYGPQDRRHCPHNDSPRTMRCVAINDTRQACHPELPKPRSGGGQRGIPALPGVAGDSSPRFTPPGFRRLGMTVSLPLHRRRRRSPARDDARTQYSVLITGKEGARSERTAPPEQVVPGPSPQDRSAHRRGAQTAAGSELRVGSRRTVVVPTRYPLHATRSSSSDLS
jgi:hypothetical protein